MSSQVSLIIMTGVGHDGEAAEMMAGARVAITQDLVARALETGVFREIIVSTNSEPLAEALKDKPIELVLDPPDDGEPFHFGRCLQHLVDRFGVEKLVYMGGGSGPLLTPDEMILMAEKLEQEDEFLITNNFYSTDFAALCPARALHAIEPPDIDNDLGWLLVRQAGLQNYSPPRTAATQLDVDTPIDLMTILGHPAVGPHLARYLRAVLLGLGG